MVCSSQIINGPPWLLFKDRQMTTPSIAASMHRKSSSLSNPISHCDLKIQISPPFSKLRHHLRKKKKQCIKVSKLLKRLPNSTAVYCSKRADSRLSSKFICSVACVQYSSIHSSTDECFQ